MDDQSHGSGLPFWKYHGTGNDFVMLDNRSGQLTGSMNPDMVRRICDRHLGVGGDGLIVLEQSGGGSLDFRMQYFNCDGSGGALCGNGARCAVAFALELGVKPRSSECYRFMDRDQRILEGYATRSPDTEGTIQIGVRMPDVDQVQFHADTSGFFVDTGCPHLVLYVDSEADLDSTDVSASGSVLRNDFRFRATGGTNVDFVCHRNRADDGNAEVIRVRTFERGVEAETLSCGTGAVAATVVDFYRKFVVTPEILPTFDSVTSGEVFKRTGDDVNSKDNVTTFGEERKSDVISTRNVIRMCDARTGDVIGIDGVAKSDLAGWGDPEIGKQRRYVRHVESKGGKLTVRVDWNREPTTGNIVFRNIWLSGPTTKVFRGRYFV